VKGSGGSRKRLLLLLVVVVGSGCAVPGAVCVVVVGPRGWLVMSRPLKGSSAGQVDVWAAGQAAGSV